MSGDRIPPSSRQKRRLSLVRLGRNGPTFPAELGPVSSTTRIASVDELVSVFGASAGPGITVDGERIPPVEGDSPCADYDPAGLGAGVEEDGAPQCATCGFSLAAHASASAGPPSGVRVGDHLSHQCHICKAGAGAACDVEIHARHSRGEPIP